MDSKRLTHYWQFNCAWFYSYSTEIPRYSLSGNSPRPIYSSDSNSSNARKDYPSNSNKGENGKPKGCAYCKGRRRPTRCLQHCCKKRCDHEHIKQPQRCRRRCMGPRKDSKSSGARMFDRNFFWTLNKHEPEIGLITDQVCLFCLVCLIICILRSVFLTFEASN